MAAPSTSMVKQFADTFTALARQTTQRLPSIVDTDWNGEEKYYDQYGNATMVEIVSRLQATPVQDGDHRRRRVTPRYYVSNILKDSFEALNMKIDSGSGYMQAQKAAVELQKDQTIIDALGGTAYTGKAGATSVTIAAAQKVTVMTTTTGLTKAKIIRAKRILDASEVEKEDRTLVHTAAQLEEVLATTEIGTIDYANVKALVQGEPGTFCGFTFVRSELLTTDTNSYRLCYAYQKKGVLLAMQREPTAKISEREDYNYAWQYYISMALGATRMEEVRVVQIACYETAL